jgi:hypothetical protein
VAEARDGRVYNVDQDSADSLKIYLEGMSLAISIADAYTKQYGTFATIPFDNHQAEENSRIGSDLVVGSSLQATAGSSVSEEDEDSEEGGDGTVSDEELARRLNESDEDGEDDADESDDLASDE